MLKEKKKEEAEGQTMLVNPKKKRQRKSREKC
jgi:hypothetical protein